MKTFAIVERKYFFCRVNEVRGEKGEGKGER